MLKKVSGRHERCRDEWLGGNGVESRPGPLSSLLRKGRSVLSSDTEASRCPQQPRPSVTPHSHASPSASGAGVPSKCGWSSGPSLTWSRCYTAECWALWQVIKTVWPNTPQSNRGNEFWRRESGRENNIHTLAWEGGVGGEGTREAPNTHTPPRGFLRPRHNTDFFPLNPLPCDLVWDNLCLHSIFNWSFFTTSFIKKLLKSTLLLLLSRLSCVRLCDPIDSSLQGSPVPGILQARILEWGAISFSNAWKWKVKVKALSHVRLSIHQRGLHYLWIIFPFGCP